MKNTYSLIVIIGAVLLIQCKAKQAITYEFPPAMSPAVQEEYKKICDKGKALYDINCAKCHTTYVKGKEVIPDFNAAQIEAYQIRVLNETHEKNLTETKLTAEELGLILTFLSYKKKNPTPKP
ncbi:MAG: c-type cytochrome [Bacteroidota bacterium]